MDIADPPTTMSGVISAKSKFSAHNGQPAITRYFVELQTGGTALAETQHVHRDRRHFTKQVLRAFLRHAISREAYDGSPWMVKEQYAKQYNLDVTVPRWLQEGAVRAHRKAVGALSKSKIEVDRITPKRAENMEEMAATIVDHKGKLPQDLAISFIASYKGLKDPSTIPLHPPSTSLPVRQSGKDQKAAERHAARNPPPPEIKYPREDLEVKPRGDRIVRPRLSFAQSDKTDFDTTDSLQPQSTLTNVSVGKSLMTWACLNMHSKYFVLDSFTYDDFLEAMRYNSADTPCELFVELHCAVLKTLVNAEGNLQANIPSLSDVSTSGSPSADESTVSSPAAEDPGDGDQPMDDVARRSSSVLSEAKDSHTNGSIRNNAKLMLGETDWRTKIKNADFAYGGWELAMVGFLNHMSIVGYWDETPDHVLSHLAPLDEPATQETARRMYARMSVNLRLAALECAVMIASTTKPFKDSMELRSLQQTTDRKEKVDAQRRRKPL